MSEGPRDPHAPRWLAAAVLGAALLGALLLPGRGAGLGLLLVILAMVIPPALHAGPRDPWSALLGGLALGLATMTVVRGAPWLLALDVTIALGLAAMSQARARTWPAFARAPVDAALSTFRVPRFVMRPLVPETSRNWAPALRGALIAGVLLLVFGSLFAAADRAFAQLAQDYLVPTWNLDLLPARIAAFLVVGALGGTLTLIAPAYARDARAGRGAPPEPVAEQRTPRRLGRLEWALPLVLLDLLFLAFVLVQITVLFGGRSHVLGTAGLTYAEYARQGFFQLLAVAGLTLLVVATTARWAGRTGERDERLMRGLLGSLLALTLVVLASALRRLGLYEDVFGLTRARLLAHDTALWLGSIIVLVSAAGAARRTGWLPRAVVAVSAASVLALSVSNPDARIATVNVHLWEETGRIDLDYLGTLGPDAVPELATLPPVLRACLLPRFVADLGEDGFAGWNLGRARAKATITATWVTPSRCRYPT